MSTQKPLTHGRGLASRRDLDQFVVSTAPLSLQGHLGRKVFAYSKSEARAALRNALRLERLPVGMVLTKVR